VVVEVRAQCRVLEAQEAVVQHRRSVGTHQEFDVRPIDRTNDLADVLEDQGSAKVRIEGDVAGGPRQPLKPSDEIVRLSHATHVQGPDDDSSSASPDDDSSSALASTLSV